MGVDKLALFGGAPVREEPFPGYQVLGREEVDVAQRVIESGVLSRFLGAWDERDFYGGPEVKAFEKEWSSVFNIPYSIAVNSCTSGLYAAVGAAGVGPGDEVIVSPYTMSASVTAAIIFNAVPVFADIDPQTFCLSAASIKKKITPRTKAIIVVHIFGRPADMAEILELAAEYGIIVIEDCAQAPLASYRGQFVGGLGHIGVFSLNYHKHIHTGEGGMITTSDPVLCEKLQLIRNHAEAVIAKFPSDYLENMVGFNFRLGEIEAAIGREQLKKVKSLVDQRRANVKLLEELIGPLEGLSMPVAGSDIEHSYYVHALSYDASTTGVLRDHVVRALRAELPHTVMREKEGALLSQGYVKPLYLLPMFQARLAFGSLGCPFSCPLYKGEVDYSRGLCVNAEAAHFERVITHELMRPGMQPEDLRDVAEAFHKVWRNLDTLQGSAISGL